MSECVCDLYGGCCDDAREREYRRTFGVSENATKGSPAKAGGTGYGKIGGLGHLVHVSEIRTAANA